MSGVKSFLQPCNSTPFSPYFHSSFPPKLHSNLSPNLIHLNSRNCGLVSAVKKQKRGSKKSLELAAFDELDDDDEDEDEEGVFSIPLSGMTEWFDKKPSGFGEGKEYDTSVEDKLLEELEQSRKAQIVNINNLKKNPSLGNPKDQQVSKAPEVIPSGVCVRIGNLPRKKNIQRDLQTVFKGFPAIVSISPAVSGTKKTRDPICKGFAFVYLGSMQAANTFVQTYSKQSITFGKIQKQVTCEIATPSKSPTTVRHMSTPGMRLPLMDSDSEDEDVAMDSASEDEDIALESTEVVPPDEEAATIEAMELSVADINISEPNVSKKTSDSSPLKQQKKKPAVKKKLIIKGKSEKPPKSNIPGSTKRLKVKEKAVLAGVVSKYGAKG
ncbi:hypothetical protein ACHQM5_006978 [Ranunculus cassubicifolius]